MAYAKIRWNEYLSRCRANGEKPHDPENGMQALFDDIYKEGKAPWVQRL